MADWIPGAIIVKATQDGGSMLGGTAKVVWHTTENDPTKVSALAVAQYLNRVGSQIHIVWNPVTGQIVQSIPAHRAGRGLMNSSGGVQTNRGGSVVLQIEVVGRATSPFTSGPCVNLSKILAFIKQLGIPAVWPAGTLKPYPASYAGSRSATAWGKAGHFGHSQVPENFHGDPGALNQVKLIAYVRALTTPVRAPIATTSIGTRNITITKAIQNAIHVTTDGKWGAGTDRAATAVIKKVMTDVRYLQARVGVTQDGIWGRNSESHRIDAIKRIQAAIRVTADGLWGPASQTAWIKVRAANLNKF